MRTRTLLPCALIACSALLASNCDAEPSSAPSPSITSTPTPPPSSTPTPRPTPPTIPPAATTGLTITSAEAFARFYLAALDYATATGDATPMRRWAEKTCIACSQLADKHERQYKSGGSITGDHKLRIDKITQVQLIRKDTAIVMVDARYGRHTDIPKAGAKPTTYVGGRVTWDLTLAAANGRWIMFEMVQK